MDTLKDLYDDLPKIEEALDYKFKDPSLLAIAFIHCSYVNENRDISYHNERLEFLGDAVLGMIIADFLFHRFPQRSEGDLSSLRSRLVEAPSCMVYVQKLDVDKYLRLGKGEKQTNSRGKQSILADLFEAIIGAIYLDGGIELTKEFIFTHFMEEIEERMLAPGENWKALYQDLSQKQFQKTPTYSVISTSGPEHNKIFEVAVYVGNEIQGKGVGHSKKLAQQAAALDALKKQFPDHMEFSCL